MKKISKEITVGVTVLVSLVVFIWLFSFLKGNNLFYSNDRYYALFDDIGGLEESAPVEINGYKAGIVRSIRFINDGSGKLLVSMGIKTGYSVPLGTIAEITPETVLAGMKVRLLMTDNTVFHQNGDTLTARLDMGFINTLSNDLSPVIRKADQIMSEIDTVLNGLKLVITDDFRKNITESSKNMENISHRLDTLLDNSGAEISSLIANLDNFSQMLRDNSETLDTTISQLAAISGSLSGSDLGGSVDNFNSAVKETTILLEKLNKGEGSAGLLLNDDSLYTSLTISLEQLNLLLEDLKSNPGRYVNFSVFGRKKNK
ncbi:MAG: MCE family protein [Bacteroidales bacterium]|nr:MCE family protein [Bacteroidales bacterium]